MSRLASADRRRFLASVSVAAFSGTLFPGVLWGIVQKKEAAKITREMIDEAAEIAGIVVRDEHKEMMLDDLNEYAGNYRAVRELKLGNDVPPAVQFDPVLPGMKLEAAAARPRPLRLSRTSIPRVPSNLEEIAYFPVRQLAELVRTRRVTSTALTEMYIERLQRYDPVLHFLITPTFERGRAQGKEADAEIARGRYRGPLHGIPWGAKDLINVKGHPTTWGAAGFEQQKFDEDATVVKRLDAAGAVLLGKMSVGALAMGDLWFGERTRNPWRPEQGSSGSSAGSASATAAGCIAFGIGSETLGSISSPATRCGSTGLRPTFGRIPRTGAMALSWSMDKIGPLCRSVEDCAIILYAIHGADQQDSTARSIAFDWDTSRDLSKLRIGYAKLAFEEEPEFAEEMKPEDRERLRQLRIASKQFDDAALEVLRRKLGVKLIEVQLPKLPSSDLLPILTAEAAAAFDELTRSGRDRLLTAQEKGDWPNTFRAARFIPAVEYVNANRARTLLMRAMADVFTKVDVFIAPTESDQLVITNLTGHPAVVLPNGFRPADAPAPDKSTRSGGPGTPVSITFVGNLYGEADLLALAKAYQDATGFHLKKPEAVLRRAVSNEQLTVEE